jgi:hypothetical protein
MQTIDAILKQQMLIEIEKFYMKLGEALDDSYHESEISGTNLGIHILFDIWKFYKENKPKINNLQEYINMNMGMFVHTQMYNIKKIAYRVYNIEDEQFDKYFDKYIKHKKIPDLKMNNEDIIEKRSLIYETKYSEEYIHREFMKELNQREDCKEMVIERNKKMGIDDSSHIKSDSDTHIKSDDDTDLCRICKNTEKLISIKNAPHDNKFLCKECYFKEKKEMNYSKIKNDKSYIMK